MKYKQITARFEPFTEETGEIWTALMAEQGYDSFIQGENREIQAYILLKDYREEAVRTVVEDFPMPNVKISYEATDPEDKDWNEEWEKNFFQPIVISDRCVVYSTFHKDVPVAEYPIVINPQMAFGTGHHATTSLLLTELLDADLQGKRLLDMGCGTSILAILASMRGADPVTAIDIDDWCVNNSKENMMLNKISNINAFLGDASSLVNLPKQDVILANINRNVLLNDMPLYVQTLVSGGDLWMSGFYTEDIPVLLEKASTLGLTYISKNEKDNWACLHLQLN